MTEKKPLKSHLETEIPVNFLHEHVDASDVPGGLEFELDVIHLIRVELGRLDALDIRRRTVKPETTYLFGQHAREVAQDLEAVCRHVGANERVATALHYLALVHDVGKLFLPFEIWGTEEKPSKDFKALRRAHGPIGAAYLAGDPALIDAHVPARILPYLKGEYPMDEILPGELSGKVSWGAEKWEDLRKTIENSPFKGKKTAFMPLAVAAALRHHEPTGTDAPENQPCWLKLLALIEDLSGNMTERPHFDTAGRGTTLDEAVEHMREEGPESHDLDLLDLIHRVKRGRDLAPSPVTPAP